MYVTGIIYKGWECRLSDIKKGYSHEQPIFVNLKSNTMKNTLQMYEFGLYLQIIRI